MSWQQSWLPRLILYLAAAMLAAGLIVHGLHPAHFERGWNNVLARPNEMLALRFLLQPLVSVFLAIRDGIKDARSFRPAPDFWTALFDPARHFAALRQAVVAAGKLFLIAMLLDTIYQLLVLKTFYPVEALVVATLLAFVPYLILRGPAARIARRLQSGPTVEPRT